jgi:hypothetical protein
MAHATRNLTVTLDKSANPPVTVVEGNLSVGKHDYRIIWKPADSPYQDPPRVNGIPAICQREIEMSPFLAK